MNLVDAEMPSNNAMIQKRTKTSTQYITEQSKMLNEKLLYNY